MSGDIISIPRFMVHLLKKESALKDIIKRKQNRKRNKGEYNRWLLIKMLKPAPGIGFTFPDFINLLQMAKRNLVDEIRSVKSRSEFNSMFDFRRRLEDIERAVDKFSRNDGSYNDELLKYIPIATVASFEVFFRLVIKELIDFGRPFSDRIADFSHAKNVKLDFDVIAAVQTKTLTIGEFVSHILPCNNLQDINSNLSTITNQDFLVKLKEFNKKYKLDTFNKTISVFHARAGQVIQSVERTFELRHIFCHEFATNIKIDADEIRSNYMHCRLFLEHVSNYIYEILYPDAPETQQDMNQMAKRQYEEKERVLSKLVKEIKHIVIHESAPLKPLNETFFDNCFEKWKEYRKLHAEFRAAVVTGGTIYPLVFYEDMKLSTQEKIQSLENEFEIPLRRLRAK